MDESMKKKLADKHGLLWELPEGIQMTATADELMQPDTAKRFLEIYAGLIPSPSIQPSATYFCSWVRSLAASVHVLLASGRSCLSLRPADWTVVLAKPGAYGMIGFLPSSDHLHGTDESKGDVHQLLNAFYGDLIAPILSTIAEVSGVRLNDLWRILATNVQYTRGSLLAEFADDDQVFAALESDFRYVLEDMPGERLGQGRNPMAFPMRYVDDPYRPGEKSMMKASCCLAYMTDYAKYCYTCPRLKASQRQQMYEEIRGLQKA